MKVAKTTILSAAGRATSAWTLEHQIPATLPPCHFRLDILKSSSLRIPPLLSVSLGILETIHNFPVSHKLFDPPNSHAARDQSSLHVIRESRRNLRALPCISKFLMVTDQMLLVPWILLHALVVFHILEDDLAETVNVGKIAHLWIEKLCHQGARSFLVVDLLVGEVSRGINALRDDVAAQWLTCVHRLIPYLTISPLVIGAETLTMWLR